MFENESFYTPADVSAAFQVAASSVYQSLPGKSCRVKLGKPLPEPLRLGRLIRWTGRQLNEWAGIPQSTQAAPQPATGAGGHQARPPGRPRKLQGQGQGQGSAA